MIKDTSGILNLEYYLGSNLGSLENPILLSFALYLDGYDLVQNNPNHKLNNKMSFVGIDIAGHITINKNIDIEYKAGYSYLFSGVYWIRSYANKSYLNGGHRFEVSIGMLYRQNRDNLIQTEVNKKLDFYTRFKVIYYDINASDVILINSKPINYPMSKNLMFMLEFGIASHFNYRIFH
ncbi:hypothetical protein [Helicobacter sp. MIT 14-3879]|uniref:hypothetical protein n=1 Tax=Helicobacter sp. MIT 14-3879 TaxID=2040649 RepID=UPI000E1F92C8|nr:hypothetical protein [Helicobacter sp. MIT 14-3879]RDU60611.1 hypothetical protein CQA44_10315 [Helicobacter sp. MIT 14-3879]